MITGMALVYDYSWLRSASALMRTERHYGHAVQVRRKIETLSTRLWEQAPKLAFE